MMKVSTMTRLTLTPISEAVSASWATARIALPEPGRVHQPVEEHQHRDGHAEDQHGLDA